ncbi:MAG: hypothetical protein Ct9H300mP8_05500 [Gammaproteobacteria bacterium]|nr:MAG: hypothetical protein Ct9H300mP8_05500 [Gammaproteobacteria bacterium]
METYLVGGAVRDQLMSRPVSERDWVSSAQAIRTCATEDIGRSDKIFRCIYTRSLARNTPWLERNGNKVEVIKGLTGMLGPR